MNWIDNLIALCSAAAFLMGIAGRGFVHLSLLLTAAVVSAAAAYSFSDSVVSGGFTASKWFAVAAVFAASFVSVTAAGALLKKVSTAGAALKIADGIASAVIVACAAALALNAAEKRTDTPAVQDSVIYSKITELYETATGKRQ